MKSIILKLMASLDINPTSTKMFFLNIEKKFFQFIDRNEDRKKRMVNIGGIRFFKRHWLVMDYKHPQSRHYDAPGVDLNYDLLSGERFPFADNSIDFFTSAHTLEHVLEFSLDNIFSELYRCLKPGGVVRITVPDYDFMYDKLVAGDKHAIINAPGDHEYYRYVSAAEFYGNAQADKMFPSPPWPRTPHVKPGPFSDDEVVDFWLRDVAGHQEGKFTFEELRQKAIDMGREAFGDFITDGVDLEWKRQNPGAHNTWFNYAKFERLLKDAGFSEVYESAPNKSKFEEFRGIGKQWGFDWRRMETSVYVEAVK